MKDRLFLDAVMSKLDLTGVLIQRLLFGACSGFPGVWVDQFGRLVVVHNFNTPMAELQTQMLNSLEVLGAQGFSWIFKFRASEGGDFHFEYSDPTLQAKSFEAQEDGIKFEIHSDPAHDFGVYTDAAYARSLVRRMSSGKKVLNLFSYTCGFGLAAAAGQAVSVVNVDPNRDYLTWGKRNAALNGCDFAVVPETAQKYLQRLLTRKEKGVDVGFDLAVVDPPAFGVGRGSERILRTLWPEILGALRQIVKEDLILLFNDLYFRKTRDVLKIVEQELGSDWIGEWSTSEGDRIVGMENVKRALREPQDPHFAPPLLAKYSRKTLL